jgi:hypothetical protein
MAGEVVLQSRFPEIAANAERKALAVVEKTTLDIEAAAKARLIEHGSVDSGALLNSGESAVAGYEGEVGFGTDHSNFIEFGTGERGAASEFLGKPGHITYSPDWKGMAARPYLIPSVEEARAPFEMAVGHLYG